MASTDPIPRVRGQLDQPFVLTRQLRYTRVSSAAFVIRQMNKKELTAIRMKFITPALVRPAGKWDVMTQVREEF
jgi:hypothetical protein